MLRSRVLTSRPHKVTRTSRLVLAPPCFQPDGKSGSPSVPFNRNLKGPCVVDIHGKSVGSTRMVSDSTGSSMQTYMTSAADHFANMELPLGGKMTKIDDTHLNMTVPRIELFDLWIQPRAVVKVTLLPNRLEVTSTTGDCVMDGSEQIKKMGLNERYNLDVRIILTWKDGVYPSTMDTNGAIKVQVDVPAPFSFLPKGVIKAAGDAAMTATLRILVTAFLDRLSKDYGVWSRAQKAPLQI